MGVEEDGRMGSAWGTASMFSSAWIAASATATKATVRRTLETNGTLSALSEAARP
jgi:hypothetical protein